MVCDHQVRLLRTLARSMERAASEVGASIARASLAVGRQAGPELVGNRDGEFVPIAVPASGLEGLGQADDDPALAAQRRLCGGGAGAVNLPLQATVLIPALVRQEVLLARCSAGGHQACCAGVAAPALCHREAEVQRQQGLQHRSVLLRVLVLERDRRTRHDEALAERACHHQRRNQGTEGLARSGAGLDHRDVFAPASTTFIRLLPAASQSVRDSGDHLELGTPRPEPSDAVPQRVHALPDEVLVGVGQHRSRLRVNPARSSHRVALVRLVLRGLTAQHGVGQGRNDVKDKGLARQSSP